MERPDNELRKNWRTKWLKSIKQFADVDAQRRFWLDSTSSSPHRSFVELYCSYFDDLNLAEREYDGAVRDGLVRPGEADAVIQFHRTAHAYDSPTNDYDHEAILADPNWSNVVSAAQDAQAALLQLIDDARERRLLTQP